MTSKKTGNLNSSLLRKLCVLVLLGCFATQSLPAYAATPQPAPQTRLVVRDSLGLNGLLNLCGLLGCSTVEGLGDPQGQLFMIEIPSQLAPLTSLLNLSVLGLVTIETDQVVQTQGASATSTPSYLNDRASFSYYGTTVWHGYVYQPANTIIRTGTTQSAFNTAGSGVIVADIDTGVDPNHPVLKSSLLTGYDFTRNQSGGSETSDVSQSTVAVLDGNGTQTAQVSQSTVAVLDQSTVAVLDGNPAYSAFGHGTMTAGIIHLVAPQAKILPLKSFQANGSGYNSDILRAIYYAVGHGAKVINMSFNYTTYSQELANAVNYATANGVICVAAAGNSGEQATVYPAALKGVIDVASTSNSDGPSTFSNYGAPPVWLAAPGEGVMTTYPFGTYAAGWGTSFSTPLVSGTTALLVASYNGKSTSAVGGLLGSLLGTASSASFEPQAANALAHTDAISDPQMGHGRLDTYLAVQAWRTSLGLN
ncbi:MAG TPA: S8 family serine peptidase [Terriglobales bacterium]|jgi:subtilisin family serine protease|nr:S8 family serine peptidase [Terriglobales bacterium]